MAGLQSYRCCKPRLSGNILERSIVYSNGSIWQVLLVEEGGSTLLMPKYRVGNGPLRSPLLGRLERLVWAYRPAEISRVSRGRDPCLGGPVALLEGNALVCDPRCRREELLIEPRDELEIEAASLIAELEALGVRVYPTGSLLGYYHDPKISDIDLVVYIDEIPCQAAIEALQELLKPLPQSELLEWAASRDAHPRLYRVWLRGVYRSKRVSVTYALTSRAPCETSIEASTRLQRRRLILEPGDCRSLIWPHVGLAVDGLIIASFDGVHAPMLYEGGVVEVQGLEAYVKTRMLQGFGMLLGVSEAVTRLTPLL